MTSLKRFAGAGSAAVLLAFSLTACGGGAPTDASSEDFCDAYNGQLEALGEIDPEGTPEEQSEALVDALKDYADKLEEVGTPENISDDAREGFEITIDELGDLDAGDVQKAIEDGNNEFAEVSKDDEEKAAAFDEYATKECGGATE
jgi:hypothetical protein